MIITSSHALLFALQISVMAASRGERTTSLYKALTNTILYFPATTKAIILVILIFICSIVPSSIKPQSEFFEDTDNILNKYYVKWLWGWTLICIVPVVFITSILYTGLNFMGVVCHFGRVATGHVIWYVMTSLFIWFRKVAGVCSNDEIFNYSQCVNQGNIWDGIDISGHVFLIVYCVLVITEEYKAVQSNTWDSYGNFFNSEQHYVSKLPDWKRRLLPWIHSNTGIVVKRLEMVAVLEMILDVVMVTVTSLYYHTFFEKISGLLIALTCWYLTYYLIYGSYKWVPCKVSYGVLNPASTKYDDNEHK